MAVVLCFWAFPVFLLFSLRVGVPARYQSSFDQVIDRYRYRGPNCSPVVPLLAACRLCPVASGASLLVIVLLIHDSRQFRVSFLFSFFFSFFGCFFVTRVWFLVDSSSLCCFCIVFFGRPCQSFCCCHYRASASLPLIFLSITMVSCLPFFCGC